MLDAPPQRDPLDPRRALHGVMRRLHDHRREMAHLEALRADELDRIEGWFNDRAEGERTEIGRLEAEAQTIALELRALSDGKVMSWATPWGTASTRVNGVGRTIVDDKDALLTWALEHGYASDPKPAPARTPDIRKLRAAAVVHDGHLVLINIDEGEDPAAGMVVPGVHIEGLDEITADIDITL